VLSFRDQVRSRYYIVIIFNSVFKNFVNYSEYPQSAKVCATLVSTVQRNTASFPRNGAPFSRSSPHYRISPPQCLVSSPHCRGDFPQCCLKNRQCRLNAQKSHLTLGCQPLLSTECNSIFCCRFLRFKLAQVDILKNLFL
jgi:hypothetical protein